MNCPYDRICLSCGAAKGWEPPKRNIAYAEGICACCGVEYGARPDMPGLVRVRDWRKP